MLKLKNKADVGTRVEKLVRQLEPLCLRRTHRDLETPTSSIHDVTLFIALTRKQTNVYDKIIDDIHAKK